MWGYVFLKERHMWYVFPSFCILSYIIYFDVLRKYFYLEANETMNNRRKNWEFILYASVFYIAMMGSPGAAIFVDIPRE